jgi:hypothetical protein
MAACNCRRQQGATRPYPFSGLPALARPVRLDCCWSSGHGYAQVSMNPAMKKSTHTACISLQSAPTLRPNIPRGTTAILAPTTRSEHRNTLASTDVDVDSHVFATIHSTWPHASRRALRALGAPRAGVVDMQRRARTYLCFCISRAADAELLEAVARLRASYRPGARRMPNRCVPPALLAV